MAKHASEFLTFLPPGTGRLSNLKNLEALFVISWKRILSAGDLKLHFFSYS